MNILLRIASWTLTPAVLFAAGCRGGGDGEADTPNNPPPTVGATRTGVTDGSTVYEDSRGDTEVGMTAGDFWVAVMEGSLIDARRTESSTSTLTATEVGLEMH